MENKTEGEKETMGIEKNVEKIERMSEAMVPRISKKEELFQKNKASLEDWKKVAEKSSRVDFALVESLEKLMEVKQDLDGVKGKVLQKIQASEDSVNEKQWEKEAELLEKNGVLMDFYEQRKKIVESIPNFWSTVFMNYLMQRSVANVDKQIIKYLESVDVKGRPYVTPVFRVTLNFGENRFFENPSLIRTINYSRERITSSIGTDIKWKAVKGITAGFEEKSNDQSDTDMREENSTDIKWKTGKGITAGFEEKSSDWLDTDIHKSFFTWFEDSSEKLHDELDEVANSIAHTLWLYAPNYYVEVSCFYPCVQIL
ncbi:hypothetical protein MKW98_019232 [Papaver atlanticum]|uniref:Uncharacterized protein n=1 Tax=Papaver atlanticum TaxID=357466 RepID=A0AAD4TCE0_9MAGN|nr:hypothetical protein MKW98_019232 [Papaver atlanticum]